MLEINSPQALTELTEAFEAYDRALLANDIEALNELFWSDHRTLRYGVNEQLYGFDAIARFRRDRGAVDQRRTRHKTIITTFGRDFGTAHTEYVPEGTERVGRQSQTWIRIESVWKIVSAHVSFLAQ